VGLISDDAWQDYLAKQERTENLRKLLETSRVNSELPSALADKVGVVTGQTYAQLLKRPEVGIDDLAPVARQLMPGFFARQDAMPVEVRNELKSVETEIKYAGYLQQQEKAIERLKKAEERSIPEWFDYSAVSGLSREMNEKLTRVRPGTLGQASRIPGVTPAAVSLINVYIEIQGRRRTQAQAFR